MNTIAKDKQLQIIPAYKSGRSVRYIAKMLGISKNTVKLHLHNESIKLRSISKAMLLIHHSEYIKSYSVPNKVSLFTKYNNIEECSLNNNNCISCADLMDCLNHWDK